LDEKGAKPERQGRTTKYEPGGMQTRFEEQRLMRRSVDDYPCEGEKKMVKSRGREVCAGTTPLGKKNTTVPITPRGEVEKGQKVAAPPAHF